MSGPEFFRFRNRENWFCQHTEVRSVYRALSHANQREGRVNQNAILLIYIDKQNQPRDQTHILFGAYSLPVVKSRWEVKLSSEDSRASWNQSKQRQLLACLTAMLNEGDASFPTKGQLLEGSMLSNSAAKPLFKRRSGRT